MNTVAALLAQIPQPVQWVLFGSDFPQADTDAMRRTANAWEASDKTLQALHDRLATISDSIPATVTGATSSQLTGVTDDMVGQLDQHIRNSHAMAGTLDAGALDLQKTQIEAGIFGAWLAFELGCAMFGVFAGGPAVGGILVASARQTFLTMLRDLITRLLRAGLYGALFQGGADFIAQVAQIGLTQIGWSTRTWTGPNGINYDSIRDMGLIGAAGAIGGTFAGAATGHVLGAKRLARQDGRLTRELGEAVGGMVGGATAQLALTGHLDLTTAGLINTLASGAAAGLRGGHSGHPSHVATVEPKIEKYPYRVLPDPGESGGEFFAHGMWGKFGAADVLIKHTDERGRERFLIVKESQKADHGQWRLPRTALSSAETPAQAVARVLENNFGAEKRYLQSLEHKGSHVITGPDSRQHSTMAAQTKRNFTPRFLGAEIEAARWLTRGELMIHAHRGMIVSEVADILDAVLEMQEGGTLEHSVSHSMDRRIEFPPNGTFAKVNEYHRPDYTTSADWQREFVGKYARYSERLGEISSILDLDPGLASTFGTLPKSDIVALRAYTYETYLDVNTALRKNSRSMLVEQEAHIRAISSALNQLPPHHGVVYRSVGNLSSPELVESIIEAYSPGTIVREPAFISTTSRRPTPHYHRSINFEIQSHSGRTISNISEYMSEEEILFPPGTRFKVTSRFRDPSTGYWHIGLTDIGNPDPYEGTGTTTVGEFVDPHSAPTQPLRTPWSEHKFIDSGTGPPPDVDIEPGDPHSAPTQQLTTPLLQHGEEIQPLEPRDHTIDESHSPDTLAASSNFGPQNEIHQAVNDTENIVPVTMRGWEQIGPQLGSNPGGTFRDLDGKEWYLKAMDSDIHAKNEVLANLLYRDAGVPVPEVGLVELDERFPAGKLGVRSEIIAGSAGHYGPQTGVEHLEGLTDHFAVDAWLGNWDVIGLGFDNFVLSSDIGVVRIDAGGALLYRAQGGEKGAMFGATVTELHTLRDARINKQSALVFSHVNDQQIRSAVERIYAINEKQIDRRINSLSFPSELAGHLGATLKARRLDLVERVLSSSSSNAQRRSSTSPPE